MQRLESTARLRRSNAPAQLSIISLLTFACYGCAGGLAERPELAQPGPDGARSFTLRPTQLAYGQPTGDRSVRSEVDLEPYLRASTAPRSKAKPARMMAPRPEAPSTHEVAAARPRVADVQAGGADPEPVPRLAAVSADTPPPPPLDAERYAQREAQSSDLLKYRGGDVIVISASTVIIVLLVVLLVVLLT